LKYVATIQLRVELQMHFLYASLESTPTVVVYRQMSDYDDVVAGGDNDKPSK